MTDPPASWRMPNRKQMEKMAADVSRSPPASPGLPPDADLPDQYWQAILQDPRAAERRVAAVPCAATLPVNQISRHILRVGCRRCGRIVEIQKADAARLYGPEALWKIVGQRLLDNTCTHRTGRHEEDGCWPALE